MVKIDGLERITIILFIVFFLHKFPFIEVLSPVIVYWGIIVLLFISLLSNKNYKKPSLNYIIAIIAVPILTYLTIVLRTPSALGTYIVKIMELLIYLMMGQFLIQTGNKKLVAYLLLFILGYFLVTSFTTYRGCLIYPLASRDLASNVAGDAAVSQFYRSLNIGGFDFIYAVVLVVPLLIGAIKQKSMSLIFGILALFIIGMAVVFSQYTTALVVFLCGIASFLFKKRQRSIFPSLVLSIVLALIFMPLIVSLISNIQGEALSSNRINDIADFLSGEQHGVEEVDGMDDRLERWQVSISAILSYPILGGWLFGGDVGGHSFVLDFIALFGLFGLLLIIVLYKKFYILLILPFKDSPCYNYLYYVLLLSIFIAIVNPVANLEMMLLCFPLTGFYLSNTQ